MDIAEQLKDVTQALQEWEFWFIDNKDDLCGCIMDKECEQGDGDGSCYAEYFFFKRQQLVLYNECFINNNNEGFSYDT